MDRPTYRIIDANFNRAREAARVMEEFCRFVLNCEPLTIRAKQLRHELCRTINSLDSLRLLVSRDTLSDVGAGKIVDNQLCRSDIKDCFTAACKRLTEAFRVLAEAIQTISPQIAHEIEQLRFAAYNLERDIVLFSDSAEKFKKVRLYVIITSILPKEVLSLVQKCAAGGADCIQLRAKNIQDDEFFALAERFVRVCREANVPAIINDRADIAIAADADGVHLGQNDLPIKQVRKMQLKPLIIGLSTHSIEELQNACQHNPTYVSLGPVFTTVTKPALRPVGLDYVKQATKILAETSIFHVAIGGITGQNIAEVLAAGAKAIAVCSAVTASDDPEFACRKLKDDLNRQ